MQVIHSVNLLPYNLKVNFIILLKIVMREEIIQHWEKNDIFYVDLVLLSKKD